MGSLKLQSFKDYANASKIVATAKLEEEQKSARENAAYEFKTLLAEFGVTSVKDLNEEDRNTFFRKLGASEVSESIAIIEEGTRSQIGKIKKNGKITSVYMHYDGYPDHMLPTIKKGYKDGKAVDLLLKKGGGSGLEADPSNIKFYGDKTTIDGNMKDTESFVKDAANNGGAEFIYLYSERDSKWYMVDVYDSYDLVPAFESLTINESEAENILDDLLDERGGDMEELHGMEMEDALDTVEAYGHKGSKAKKIAKELYSLCNESMIINEAFSPSKGNLRDAKKVKKALEQFFMDHNALMDKAIFLGVCKYLLAESLTDANFHSYREPVSKVIKGKLSTVIVEVDGLGDMKIPVGKKSIVNLLDDKGAFMANAAGWSGIGIVEGMALFLDSFGDSDTAQKIVDAFNLIWANESVMNEGNAFLAARAKAIEEDAEEFEFNGKNFPVIKEEVEEVTESIKCTNKKGHSYKEVDKDGTVECEHCGLRNSLSEDVEEAGPAVAAMIAKEVLDDDEEANEEEAEEVTEAKFVKDFDKGVLDAEYKADITTYYPSAKFFIGKWSHFFGELEPNLFFKAYYAKYYKEDTGKKIDGDFKITSIYSEKGSKYVNLYVESADTVEAPTVNEAEVKSDEDFKEYAFAVLGKAFGDKFDEEKAQEVVDGLLSKHGDDYGAAVGALTASLG